MQSRSALWQQIVEGGNFQLQTVAAVGTTHFLLPNSSSYFENGTIHGGTGGNGNNVANRVRTRDFVELVTNRATTFTASDGLQFWIYKYDSSGAFLGYEPSSAVQTYTLAASSTISKIRLVIKRTTNADLAAADVGRTWSVTASSAETKTTYSQISAPKITRAAVPDALSAGNCTSAMMDISILTEDPIPKSSQIDIQMRVTDGTNTSEWLPAGTYYIQHRSTDPTSGLKTFECYDAMLKTNADYPLGAETDWPKTMQAVITEIAGEIGVTVDARSWSYVRTGDDYMVPYPEGYTMKQVLGWISGAYGCNAIITPEGKLRLVPLFADGGSINVFGVVKTVAIGEPATISRVTMTTPDDDFASGDDTGYTVEVPISPYATQVMCDNLYATLRGRIYYPYTLEGAIYDPAAEIGDELISKTDISSVLCTEKITMATAFRSDISAPDTEGIEDEYPYKSANDRMNSSEAELKKLITIVADKANITELNALRATIDNLSVSDIKAGIIHSYDYEIIDRPLIYPASTLYPAEDLYTSDGTEAVQGFAIDFASGVIRGAFYSRQINSILAAIEALEDRVYELETGPLYPRLG